MAAVVQTTVTASQVLLDAPATFSATRQHSLLRYEVVVMSCIRLLVAITVAALLVSVANFLGFSAQSTPLCVDGAATANRYGHCAAWQDFRSFLSFGFGALICCVLTGGADNICGGGSEQEAAAVDDEDDVDWNQMQFCTYTL